MIQNMGKFISHKEVHAGKITAVNTSDSGGYKVEYLDANHRPAWTVVPWKWWDKHRPEPGGYLVQYRDGYLSYSPAQAFEEGYTRIED